jgi:hypothetical protein
MTFRLNSDPLRYDRPKTTLPPPRRRPRKIGDGPATFSATTTVDRQPFVWDCNQLYARLGVATDAPRIEIARAYLALDGHLDYRLTYAFAVLVDKAMRKLYDSMPLGSILSTDPDIAVGIALDRFEALGDSEWSYYLDADLDEAPANWSPDVWRHALTDALAGTALDGVVLCVGATAGEGRIALLGYNLVIFTIVDFPDVRAYAHAVASELLAMSPPLDPIDQP